MEACIHPFFDELRDPNTRLPNGRPLPPLFNFKPPGAAPFGLYNILFCWVGSFFVTGAVHFQRWRELHWSYSRNWYLSTLESSFRRWFRNWKIAICACSQLTRYLIFNLCFLSFYSHLRTQFQYFHCYHIVRNFTHGILLFLFMYFYFIYCHFKKPLLVTTTTIVNAGTWEKIIRRGYMFGLKCKMVAQLKLFFLQHWFT